MFYCLKSYNSRDIHTLEKREIEDSTYERNLEPEKQSEKRVSRMEIKKVFFMIF